MDYQRRSKLMDQIQKMGELVLKGDLEYLDNQKYRIYFSVPKSINNFFIYAIDDKKSSMKVVKELLDTILQKFKTVFPNLGKSEHIQEVDQYQQFSKIIENTLSDERFTPIDRIKKFLL